MEQLKRVKVVMISTNQKLNSLKGYLDKSLLFNYQKEYKTIEAEKGFTGHFHLYIISEDKPRAGDWSIYQNKIHKCVEDIVGDEFKKIIATTDKLTYKCNELKVDYFLPQPSQQFIEKYIESYNKGNIITDVLVGYESKFETIQEGLPGFPEDNISWWNNKIKVNSKDNTIVIKKLKDSWDREEMKKTLSKIVFDIEAPNKIEHVKEVQSFIDSWIEENL